MFIDIVFPKNNENDLIKTAQKLRIMGLCMVYDYDSSKIKQIRKNLQKYRKKYNLEINLGLSANLKQIRKAKKLAELVITKSTTNSSNNRKNFEKYKPDLIYDLELDKRPDKIHYKRSGLNQVLCKLANKNEIMLGISFKSILNAKSKNRIRLIGRINQNLKYYRKYKVKIIIASFASNKWEMRHSSDLRSVATVLGMDSYQSKNSINNCYLKIKDNRKYLQKTKITNGIELTPRNN
ncbi:MAG: Ribonuclease P protein component 3 [Candidatus Woesearchaeota archaeon]|nr:Ribonuclease P protein component 3 [Candidatus Woesearchaeota archaeon]